jgi:hypothetical protein
MGRAGFSTNEHPAFASDRHQIRREIVTRP